MLLEVKSWNWAREIEFKVCHTQNSLIYYFIVAFEWSTQEGQMCTIKYYLFTFLGLIRQLGLTSILLIL